MMDASISEAMRPLVQATDRAHARLLAAERNVAHAALDESPWADVHAREAKEKAEREHAAALATERRAWLYGPGKVAS